MSLPPGEGWWLASDGNWYPPEFAPGSGSPPSGAPAGPGRRSGCAAIGIVVVLLAIAGAAVVVVNRRSGDGEGGSTSASSGPEDLGRTDAGIDPVTVLAGWPAPSMLPEQDPMEVDEPAVRDPETAWEAVTMEIADGVVPLDTALQAFSLAVAPLPGVTMPELPRPNEGLGYASGATRWLARYWGDLTPEQRATAASATGAAEPRDGVAIVGEADGNRVHGDPIVDPGRGRSSPGGTSTGGTSTGGTTSTRGTSTDGAVGRGAGMRRLAATTSDATIVQWAKEEEQKLEQKLGYKPSVGIVVGRAGSGASLDNPAAASRWAVDGTPWPEGCWVTVYDLGASWSENDLRSALDHELYHCFQDEWIGDFTRWSQAPPWVIEGSARWVGEVMHPTKQQAVVDNWRTYLDFPQFPLTSRSYDSVGMWGHLQDDAGEGAVWSALRPVVVAPSSADAYDAVIAVDHLPFAASWASTYFRDEAFGPAWGLNGPGPVPSSKVQAGTLHVTFGTTASVSANATANSDYELDVDADVVAVSVTGVARVGAKGVDVPIVQGGNWFCATGGTCECPDGSKPPGPAVPLEVGTKGEVPRLALTGDVAGTTAQVSGLTLDQFCKHAGKLSGWGMCGLLQPEDFTAAGVGAAGVPQDNASDWLNHYCVYDGVSAASGGVELDIFVVPKDNWEGAYAAARIEIDEGYRVVDPQIPTVDQGELFIGAGGGSYSEVIVRKGSLLIAIGVPSEDGDAGELTQLARLVLARGAFWTTFG